MNTAGGHSLVVKSKILPSISLGYNKITIENPVLDNDGKPLIKKGKIQADAALRDTEDVPLDEDVDVYLEREVLPFSPGAWIDHTKDKVGYVIPFTRTFYEYEMMEPAESIAARIELHEKTLSDKLRALFGRVE
jgi:type I restriction enzyme M protein